MDTRINKGYVITGSIQIGEIEFVFGKMDSECPMYVTWACEGGDNYYWGCYFSDLLEAKANLLDRAVQELEFQKELQNRHNKSLRKTEKEHESR